MFDNLERAIQSAQRTSDVKAMTEGLTMVQRQFIDALGREGIARVPTVGRPFDPGVHEAIQQVETSEHERRERSSPRSSPGTLRGSGSFGPRWWSWRAGSPTTRANGEGSGGATN